MVVEVVVVGWRKKPSPSNTDHNPYSLLIFPMFYRSFIEKCSSFHICKCKLDPETVPPNIIPIIFNDLFPYCVAQLLYQGKIYLKREVHTLNRIMTPTD